MAHKALQQARSQQKHSVVTLPPAPDIFRIQCQPPGPLISCDQPNVTFVISQLVLIQTKNHTVHRPIRCKQAPLALANQADPLLRVAFE